MISLRNDIQMYHGFLGNLLYSQRVLREHRKCRKPREGSKSNDLVRNGFTADRGLPSNRSVESRSAPLAVSITIAIVHDMVHNMYRRGEIVRKETFWKFPS